MSYQPVDFLEYSRRVDLLRFKKDNEPLRSGIYDNDPQLEKMDILDNEPLFDDDITGFDSLALDSVSKNKNYVHSSLLSEAKRHLAIRTTRNGNGPREGIYVPSIEDLYNEKFNAVENDVQDAISSHISSITYKIQNNLGTINEEEEEDEEKGTNIDFAEYYNLRAPEPAVVKNSVLSERFNSLDISAGSMSKWKNSLDLSVVDEEEEEEEEGEEEGVPLSRVAATSVVHNSLNTLNSSSESVDNRKSSSSLFKKIVQKTSDASFNSSRINLEAPPAIQSQRDSGNSLTTLRISTNSLENPVAVSADSYLVNNDLTSIKYENATTEKLDVPKLVKSPSFTKPMAKWLKSIKSLPNKFYRGESNETIIEGSGSSEDLLETKKRSTKEEHPKNVVDTQELKSDKSNHKQYKDDFGILPELPTQVMNVIIPQPQIVLEGIQDQIAGSPKEKQPLLRKLMMRKDKTSSSKKTESTSKSLVVNTKKDSATPSFDATFAAAAESHPQSDSRSIISSNADSNKDVSIPPRHSSKQSEYLEKDALSEKLSFEQKYKVLKKLGCGGHSTVRLAMRYSDKKLVVCKFIKETSVWHWVKNSENGSKTPLEIKIMSQLANDNYSGVIKYIEHFSYGSKFIIVMEYLGQDWIDLYDYVELYGPVEERVARDIFYHILSAVDYLHWSGYTHNDIKDENIMINAKTREIKLIDFGSATPITPDGVCEVFYGTKKFACPEAVLGKPYLPGAQETWALGTLYYVLLFRMDPFKTDEDIVNLDIKVKIASVLRRSKEQNNNVDIFNISDNSISLLEKLLSKDPLKRPTITEIVGMIGGCNL